jgi:hypothetical protein
MVELDSGNTRVFVSPYGFWGCLQASSITPKLYLGKDGYWYREFKDFFETKEEIEMLLSKNNQYFYKD